MESSALAARANEKTVVLTFKQRFIHINVFSDIIVKCPYKGPRGPSSAAQTAPASASRAIVVIIISMIDTTITITPIVILHYYSVLSYFSIVYSVLIY